jgi:hypothetical protein
MEEKLRGEMEEILRGVMEEKLRGDGGEIEGGRWRRY